MILDVNLVPFGVKSSDIVPKCSSHAQPIAVALTQEFSDSFASSNSLNGRTVLKNMPALNNNLKYFRKTCLEDIGVGFVNGPAGQAGQKASRPMPGLGAL